MFEPRKRPPQQPTVEFAHIPAPIGGVNAVDAASAMPEEDCVYLYNMIAAEYGLRSRLGFQEWCTGLTGSSLNEVRSIVPFSGSHANGSTDKLFAATQTGIWDVSASSASPSQLVTFANQGGDAAYGVSAIMSTPAGRFLLLCDETNGYYVWSENSASWTKPTMGAGAGQINGVDPSTFAAVTIWKNRAWFIQKDTTVAWYLGLNSIYGAATSFDFGAKMGGPIAGLYNWSYDGGSGIDTLLVAISTTGNIAIYAGTDPTSASTFGLKGTWHVGGVPYGRRIATDYGGDVLVLSNLGVIPLSKLVIGNPIVDRTQYATYKISNLFSRLVSSNKSLQGWSLHIHPEDNALLVAVPQNSGQATTQLAMSFATRGWSQYRDLPLLSAGVWNGRLYFGTTDGRVCLNTGYVDNVQLANPNTYTAVNWSLLSAYNNLGNGRNKQVTMIRPTLVSQAPNPVIASTAKYSFDLSEPPPPSGATVATSGTWDNAAWDVGNWSGDYNSVQTLSGATGLGRDVAIALRGSAISRTTLVGMDVQFKQGGLL